MSKPAADVVVISTLAVDRIPTADGVREVPGGPALYIPAALERLGKSYELLTGERATVDVALTDEGERYIVHPIPRIRLPPRIVAPVIILSPIVREIDPFDLPEMEGLVIADLQGFVRRPGISSAEPEHSVDVVPLLRRAHVVKATDFELGALSARSRRGLRDTALVITRGSRGAMVVENGVETHIEARPVGASRTIGAGDTFVAALAAGLLEGMKVMAAAERAARYTERFLAERVS